MNKTIGLSGLVGLMAAFNVGCGTQKHHTGRLDEKASSVAHPEKPSQVDTVAGSQAEAPASQAQAPASQAQAPASQALEPGMQVTSPCAQEQASSLPFQQVWQDQSQEPSQTLPAMSTEASPWGAGQQSAADQLSSAALPDQQTALGETSTEGSQLERLTRDQAFDRVNQRFAVEGRDGVLALTEKNLLLIEKDLAALSSDEAAKFKQKIEKSRVQWEALSQASNDLDFVQQAADLLSDLSDIAATMSSHANNMPQA